MIIGVNYVYIGHTLLENPCEKAIYDYLHLFPSSSPSTLSLSLLHVLSFSSSYLTFFLPLQLTLLLLLLNYHPPTQELLPLPKYPRPTQELLILLLKYPRPTQELLPLLKYPRPTQELLPLLKYQRPTQELLLLKCQHQNQELLLPQHSPCPPQGPPRHTHKNRHPHPKIQYPHKRITQRPLHKNRHTPNQPHMAPIQPLPLVWAVPPPVLVESPRALTKQLNLQDFRTIWWCMLCLELKQF